MKDDCEDANLRKSTLVFLIWQKWGIRSVLFLAYKGKINGEKA